MGFINDLPNWPSLGRSLERFTEKVQIASQYEGHLLDSADSLLEITEFSLDLERQVENIIVYAHMKNDQDTREAKVSGVLCQGHDSLQPARPNFFNFYEPEFMDISESSMLTF